MATTSTVLAMPGVKRRVRQQPQQQPRPTRLAMKRQTMAAAAVAVVGATLLTLSLTHMAEGVRLLTGAPVWEAVCMAIGVDAAFVSLEVGMLAAATDKVRREIGTACRVTITLTMLGSGALNSLAFTSAATGWLVWPAALLGAAIPGLTYVLSRVAFALASTR